MSAADCMAMDCQVSLTKTIAFAQFDMSLSVFADARIGHASAAGFLCAALRRGRGSLSQAWKPIAAAVLYAGSSFPSLSLAFIIIYPLSLSLSKRGSQ